MPDLVHLLRSDLDAISCAHCGGGDHDHAQDPIAVCGKCHPTRGVTVHYYAEGFLGVACARCEAWVTSILVDTATKARLTPIVWPCKDPGCETGIEVHSMVMHCQTCKGTSQILQYVGRGVLELLCKDCSTVDKFHHLEHFHAAEALPS